MIPEHIGSGQQLRSAPPSCSAGRRPPRKGRRGSGAGRPRRWRHGSPGPVGHDRSGRERPWEDGRAPRRHPGGGLDCAMFRAAMITWLGSARFGGAPAAAMTSRGGATILSPAFEHAAAHAFGEAEAPSRVGPHGDSRDRLGGHPLRIPLLGRRHHFSLGVEGNRDRRNQGPAELSGLEAWIGSTPEGRPSAVACATTKRIRRLP